MKNEKSHLHKLSDTLMFCALVIATLISAIHARFLYRDAYSFALQISMSSSVNGEAVLYLDTGRGFSEREKVRSNIKGDNQFNTYNFSSPLTTIYNLRFDPLTTSGIISINSISVVNGFGKSLSSIDLNTLRPKNQIKAFDFKSNILNVTIEEGAKDPQILIPFRSPLKIDIFQFVTFIPFASRLFGGFIVFFLSTYFLICILRRQGVLVGFFDNPLEIMKKSKVACLVILLFYTILCLNIFSVLHLSLTYDEDWHWQYGRNILELDPRRPGLFFESTMPFSALNAVSGKIGQLLGESSTSEHSPSAYKGNLLWARLVTVVFSLLLAFYVFRWSKELYGPAAGLLSLFLYAFSPNIIAHSHLVTVDLYVTCMITIAAYYFWKFMNVRNLKNAFLSAITLGLAQLSKYTAVYLYPIFILTALLSLLPDMCSPDRKTYRQTVGNGFKSFLKYSAFFLLVSLVLINAGWFGYRSFTPLKNYEFRSHLFQQIQTTGLRHLPVSVPYPYLQGLDMVKDLEINGTTQGNMYLLGKLHTRVDNKNEGFPGYFFYAMLFKEPIATQVLILFALFFYVINRRKFAFFKNEIFLFIPVLFFLVYFNFFFRTHIGIRYILVVLPFLYILSGCSLTGFLRLGFKAKWGYVALCLYLAASVLSYFPHYLSYFNEFVWDRTKAYKYLADSNLDWGQSEFYLEHYKRTHPDAIVNPTEAVSGQIVVSVNELVGIFDPEKYRWLRNNYEPAGHIAYSYLVYEIAPESLEKIRDKGILKKR